MLTKLMKYEVIAMGRVLWPFYAVVLALAVGNNFSARVLLDSDVALFNFFGISCTVMFTLSLIAMAIVCGLLIMLRFRNNFLTDEGYVMMTLPVNIHQLIGSKLVVSMGACVVTCGVLALGMGISLFALGDVQILYRSIGQGLLALFEELTAVEAVGQVSVVIMYTLIVLLNVAAAILTAYAALAMGHSFAGYKVAISVVVYIVVHWILRLVIFVALLIVGAATSHVSAEFSAVATGWMGLILTAAGCGIFYVVTVYFMTERLNLA